MLSLILHCLKIHKTPFDEVIIGKPWCSQGGFCVNDRALGSNEFSQLSPAQINYRLHNSH